MTDFSSVRFKGTFRDYQQRVLDNANRYLKDGKINIVAAPGSGKTVLGLELVRRLNAPCIVLSPTTAIREQWGERFKDLFVDEPQDFARLFSNDLHKVKLLNSVTYQALYTAVEKVSTTDDEDIDCSDLDILNTMREFGIKTVCLDEAHHLKNEWQKALEKVISALDSDVKIIALTATPPYDSEGTEWSRYMNICGEIDEEIFVPELVGQSTLCPHQDYVYFNYPTDLERASFQDHKERSAERVELHNETHVHLERELKRVVDRYSEDLRDNIMRQAEPLMLEIARVMSKQLKEKERKALVMKNLAKNLQDYYDVYK